MYAHVNLPGSSHFETFGPATKRECESWLRGRKDWHRKIYGGKWVSTYFPAKVITNQQAKRWKYRDGTRCFD